MGKMEEELRRAFLSGGGPFHFGTFSVVCANNLGGKLMAFFLGNMRERERERERKGKGQEKEVRTAKWQTRPVSQKEGELSFTYVEFPTPNPFSH